MLPFFFLLLIPLLLFPTVLKWQNFSLGRAASITVFNPEKQEEYFIYNKICYPIIFIQNNFTMIHLQRFFFLNFPFSFCLVIKILLSFQCKQCEDPTDYEWQGHLDLFKLASNRGCPRNTGTERRERQQGRGRR